MGNSPSFKGSQREFPVGIKLIVIQLDIWFTPGIMDSSKKAEGNVFLPQIVWLIWLISLILHIFAGLNSAGVAHVDEHYQILEFVNYKLGLVSIDRLPWEFGFRMRAWIQPGLY